MKLARRNFLGLFGGAVVAGPSAAKAAADPVLKQAGFPMGGEIIAAAPIPGFDAPVGVVAKVRNWILRTGIPAWKMHEIRRQANYERSMGLDPDLACLISVSPGYKAREQRRRNMDRKMADALESIGIESHRKDFKAKLLKKFGYDVDWYV